MALALTLYEAGLCQGCGQPMHEAQSPQADPNASDRTHHYVAPPPARCHSCTAVAIRVSEYSGDDVRHPSALRFRSERVDDDQ